MLCYWEQELYIIDEMLIQANHSIFCLTIEIN